MPTPLSLEDFLVATAEEVASVAPKTIMFAAGGTRREAVLNGVSIQDPQAYAEFGVRQFTDTAERLFKLGVKHIFAVTVHSKQLNESGAYRDYVIKMTIDGLGNLALPYYKRLGCRVRLVGHEEVPELVPLADILRAQTDGASTHTIWWLATASSSSVWERTREAMQGASSQTEAIRRYFGEAVPPADIFLSFGKFFISPEILPPLLIGDETHCYFYQRPGYYLSEAELRTVFYDYAYARHTWMPDKTPRYAEVEGQRDLWEGGEILGLGQRVGSFWYPRVPEPATTNESRG
jgi:hypothetical protein